MPSRTRFTDGIGRQDVTTIICRTVAVVDHHTSRDNVNFMEPLLLALLTSLEALGECHGELYDSEVREKIGNAVMDGFVRYIIGYSVPADLGMFTETANVAVRDALCHYIDHATSTAIQLGLTTFHSRLAAFQNSGIRTNTRTGIYYDDLFGYAPPEWYDSDGNVIWDRVK